MNSRLREKAIKLRLDKEMSYSVIREILGVPKSTLSYWLKDYPLSEEKILELRRRGWKKGEASRERYRNTMRQIKDRKKAQIYNRQVTKLSNIREESIYIAGLMLYLGEGSKHSDYSVVLANTDPRIIRFWMKWLCQFLNVPRTKIRVQLHLYENMNLAKEEKFWKDVLVLSESQFYKTQIRRLKEGSFSYQESFRHGTCQISVSGLEQKTELMMGIKAFCDLYMERQTTRV